MTALIVNGETISLGETLTRAKWRGALAFLDEARDAALIRQAAGERGITVSEDELQEAADAFRQANGLHRAETTRRWLETNRLTDEEWAACLEQDALARKLRAATADPGAVEAYFAENRRRFDRAEIARIIVGDEDVARELWVQIVDEGADFHALARRYSEDGETRPAGGWVGAVARGALPADVEAAVWGAARPGEIVGPIPVDRVWHLVKVESLDPATLNDVTRAAIAAALFDAWLAGARRQARIAWPLLEGGES